ncbi:MAG: hypothetical protein COZ74_13760 [Flavobacteriaceae bacterium CG_4_8_14_3_um_filter_31_8]|nr:MAG: hypothetical protein COZ74_13760 [Flavobacteriaceae bacterium CG_4_8_14_3_um_filter_31_8]
MITYFVLSQSTKQLYENKEIITNEQVEEKPLWMRDEDAVDAAKAVIRKKELEAENVNLTAEVKKLTEIYEQEIKMREERQKEIEKELGIY